MPFPRSWLYGLGGFVVVIITFAIGYFIVSDDPPDAAAIDEPAAIAAHNSVDDVRVGRAIAEPPKRFPAFAPEGVIVVQAPSDERVFADAPEQIEQSPRRVESAGRRARSNEIRPPVAVARTEARARELNELAARPEASADELPTRSEAPSVREYAGGDEGDNRSWYGSEEYRREVQERRRAEREARRRRIEGW